ncbi:hypothetical protein DFA_00143 [Cavenderia fasciculata]|uniref:MACPF domain-containing protein n=1 Tax=Cavenderia fasciculata TaxID=261658 RepID=F4PXQ5_CACFS|nr:uncharacterized protein DFA_00143 [Cavenderia fasciculata]EGG19565.1 hypothetical protein DFA_00143 [Cavenderia fasciculata]|eukprot:XP_004357859.1 hypothetical protein DFA_00143 [Cavenderia fasciculata]
MVSMDRHECHNLCIILQRYSSFLSAVVSAIDFSTENKLTLPIILIQQGIYAGTDNKNIRINDMTIQFVTPIIIDCEGIGQGLIIENSNVMISGITFANCSKSQGSTIHALNSVVTLENCTITKSRTDNSNVLFSSSKLFVSKTNFTNNYATNSGGAIVAVNSIVEIGKGVVFSKNNRTSSNGRLVSDDIVASNKSTVYFVDAGGVETKNVFCDESSTVDDSKGLSLCPMKNDLSSASPSSPPPYCGDSFCDTVNENYFNCPQDCPSIQFSGFIKEEWTDSNPLKVSSPMLYPKTTILDGVEGPVHATLTSYFRFSQNSKLYLRVSTFNLGLKILFDRREVSHFQLQEPDSKTQLFEANVYLVQGIHQFQALLTSFTKKTQGSRNITLEYRTSLSQPYVPFNITFFSLNSCGDGIVSPVNEDCSYDSFNGYGRMDSVTNLNTTCGNKICDEVSPILCLSDCHEYITEKCPPLTVRKGSLVPTAPTSTDTLGKLIANQQVWRLPGYQHFSFGYDIVFGEQSKFPVFYFGFCNEKESNIIEDVYRDAFYEIPKELTVVPLPLCSFSITTEEFNSTDSMQKSKRSKSSMSISANANAKIGSVGVQVDASYKHDKAVSESRSLSNTKQGSTYESTVQCSSFSVEIIDPSTNQFHPGFLSDLSTGNSTDDFILLIQKYGSHFYLSGILGGTLKQITIHQKSQSESESQKDVDDMVSYSVGVSVSSPSLSASASFSSTETNDSKEGRKQKFMSESKRSTIITNGGAAGSFAPSADGAPTTFGDWANSVDILPAIVNPQLQPIRSIIPEVWVTPSGEKVVDLWTKAEEEYYKRMLSGPIFDSTLSTLQKKEHLTWFPRLHLDERSYETSHIVSQDRAKGIEISSLDLEFFVEKRQMADDYETDFVKIEPNFPTSIDPEVHDVRLLMQLPSINNWTIDQLNTTYYHTHNEDSIDVSRSLGNVIFQKTSKTFELPSEIGYWNRPTPGAVPKNYPIYHLHHISKGKLVREMAPSFFLLVPPDCDGTQSTVDVVKVGIRYYIAGTEQKRFYDRQSTHRGKWRLLEILDKTTVSQLLLSTDTYVHYTTDSDWPDSGTPDYTIRSFMCQTYLILPNKQGEYITIRNLYNNNNGGKKTNGEDFKPFIESPTHSRYVWWEDGDLEVSSDSEHLDENAAINLASEFPAENFIPEQLLTQISNK